MEIAIKLKHKPTGLYYKPVSGRWLTQRTSLSKKGKVYLNNVTEKSFPDWVMVSKVQHERYGIGVLAYDGGYEIKTNKEDWEIEKYKLVKIEE